MTFASFILDAHHSNVGHGEKVNCTIGGEELNDIHIVISTATTIATRLRPVSGRGCCRAWRPTPSLDRTPAGARRSVRASLSHAAGAGEHHAVGRLAQRLLLSARIAQKGAPRFVPDGP